MFTIASLSHLKHLHVWSELLDEVFYDELGGGRRGDPDAFCGHLLARGAGVVRLVVEPHHPMEFKLLKNEKQAKS